MPDHRIDGGVLRVGFMDRDGCLREFERWEGVRGWIMPERRRLEFWVWSDGECYKLDVLFDDILETVGFCSDDSACNAILLKVSLFFPLYYC